MEFTATEPHQLQQNSSSQSDALPTAPNENMDTSTAAVDDGNSYSQSDALPTAHNENMDTSTAAVDDGMNIAAAVQPTVPADWAWIRPSFKGKKAGINTYVRNKVIGEIKLQLRKDSQIYKQFEDSCFGKYLHFDEEAKGGCPNQAMHAMFGQQVTMSEAKDDELWFRIGENFIRFSKYEYALVTGLRFGPMNFYPNADCDHPVEGLYMRRINEHHDCLKFFGLLERFKEGYFKDQPDDQLKVAKILFVYAMLFGVDSRSVIDKWVWVLVEDNNMWENFPWGAYSYRILIKSLINKVPKELLVDGSVYHLFGYTHAFVYWMFEAIPPLAKLMMKEDNSPVKQRPRSLKWPFNWKRAEISNFFDNEKNMECHKILKPTPEEILDYAWWPNVQNEISPDIEYVARLPKAAKIRAVRKTSSTQSGRRRKLPVSRTAPIDSSPARTLVVVEPPEPDDDTRAHGDGHQDSQLIPSCGDSYGGAAAVADTFPIVSTIRHPEHDSHENWPNPSSCHHGSPTTETRHGSPPVTHNRSPFQSRSPSVTHNHSPIDTNQNSPPSKRARITDTSHYETLPDLLARLLEGVKRDNDDKWNRVIQRVDEVEQNVFKKIDEVDRRVADVKQDVNKRVDEVSLRVNDTFEGLKRDIAEMSETVIRGVGSERDEIYRSIHARLDEVQQHVTDTFVGFKQENIAAPLDEVQQHVSDTLAENIAALQREIGRNNCRAGWVEDKIFKRLDRIDDQLNKLHSTSNEELIKMVVDEVQRRFDKMDDQLTKLQSTSTGPTNLSESHEQPISGRQVVSNRPGGSTHQSQMTIPLSSPIVSNTLRKRQISFDSFVPFDGEFVDQPEAFGDPDETAIYVLSRGPTEPPLTKIWVKIGNIPPYSPIKFKEEELKIIPAFKKVHKRRILRVVEAASSIGKLTEDEQKLQNVQHNAYREFMSSSSDDKNVDVGDVVDVGRDFFMYIEDTKTELENTHIDAYLRILHNDPMFVGIHPESAGRYSVLGMQFGELVRRMFYEMYVNYKGEIPMPRDRFVFLHESRCQPLLDWVRGKEQKGWTNIVPWTEIDMIYTIWHTPQHWLPILINFKTCEVWLFDSLFYRVTPEIRLSRYRATLDLRRIIPSVLHISGFYKTRIDLKEVPREWDLRFAAPEHCFTQDMPYNCGVYSLKTIEAFISRRSVVNVDDKHIPEIRHRIAERIYTYATTRD